MKPKSVCSDDVKLDPVSGLFKIDKIPVFRFVRKGDALFIQIMDGNKPRSDGRGTNLVEVQVDEFISCVQRAGNMYDG